MDDNEKCVHTIGHAAGAMNTLSLRKQLRATSCERIHDCFEAIASIIFEKEPG